MLLFIIIIYNEKLYIFFHIIKIKNVIKVIANIEKIIYK